MLSSNVPRPRYNVWEPLALRTRQKVAYASLGSNALFASSNLPANLDFGGSGLFEVTSSNTAGGATTRVQAPSFVPV